MRLPSSTVAATAALLVTSSVLLSSPTSTAATPTPTAQATLMAQTPGLLDSASYPSSAYISTARGWTWSYNTSGGFSATATKGKTTFGFSLDSAAYTAVLHGAKHVHLDLDRNGAADCDARPNADVRDWAVDGSGRVQRLDLVFAALCGVPQSDYVIGEFSYGEPAPAGVAAMPSELFLPPTNRESTRAAFPVRLARNGRGSTTISKVAVQGSHRRDFAIAKDSCLGHAVSTADPCSIAVRYVGKRRSATATLVAMTGTGTVVSQTPLDGARLPGETYWAATDPVNDNRETVRSYRPGPQTQISLLGGHPGSRKLQLFVDTNGGPVGQLTLSFRKPVHVGTYHVRTGSKALQVNYAVGRATQPVSSGVVRVAQVGFSRTDRGHERLPALALTFELLSKPGMPTYGAVGYLTSESRRIPGFTTPPLVAHVRVHRHGRTAMIGWHASQDVAVHRYVVRVKRGVSRAVPWGGGHLVYSGLADHFRLSRRHSGRPLTVSVFAVDDRHHHSRGRTIVLRH